MTTEVITSKTPEYKVNGYLIEEMISEKVLHQRIVGLAEQIYKDYRGKDLVLVCILNGAESFFNSLKKELGRGNPFANREPMSIPEGYFGVSSYGAGHESSGNIKVTVPLNIDIKDKDALIIEDIIDSGNTVHLTRPLLLAEKPKSLEYCVLLDKAENRKVKENVKYTGFVIPNKYVVGFGLDDGGNFRNLPYVGIVKEKPPVHPPLP